MHNVAAASAGKRSSKLLVLLTIPALAGSGCNLPNNFWVNVASGGSLTATNGFVSAFVNRITQDVFGTTGSGGEVAVGADDGDGGGGH